MPEDYVDPSGNTEAFRAFAAAPEPVAEPASRRGLVIAGLIVAFVVIGVVVWLVMS